MGHRAETAVARATVSQDQEGGGALREALPLIGAMGFLTDGVKRAPLEDPVYLLVGSSGRDPPLQPRRFAQT